MVQLWIPADELKADLQDQARKRLEEIEREAEKRRNQIMQASQDKLNDQRVQAAMTRFNDMVDPLLAKGGEALEGAASGIQDTSERARQMVEEAQRSLQSAPVPDALQALNNPPTPQAPTPPPPTPSPEPTPPSPMLGAPAAPAPPSPFPGMDGQAPQPSPMPEPQPMAAPPPFPGLGGPPDLDGPPGFKPPGLPGLDGLDGLGSALADRFRGAGQGLGGLGDAVTSGRDQAMELANKSLDVAQQAMGNAGERFQQTPVARAVADAASFRPPGLPGLPADLGRNLQDAAVSALTSPSAASQTAEAIAPWTPEMQSRQEGWEGVQGKEREAGGLSGLLSGAGAAARKYEQQTREQGETLLGRGTQGEGPLGQLQAGFGYAMAPYGALPEVARGGVEEATGSPLAGSAAYFATSVLGPGGIRGFLSEGLPTMSRMLTNRNLVPAMIKSDPTGTLKAMALGAGIVGGAGYGGYGAIKGLKEGATPQEAAAQALTNAADILQISEAAGIPIDIGARVWRVLPKMPSLPGLPGMPAQPGLPGMSPGELPPPPGREGSLPPAEERPGEPAPDGLDRAADQRSPEEILRRDRLVAEARQRAEAAGPGVLPEPSDLAPPEPSSRSRRLQDEQDAADEAAARAQARQDGGAIGVLRRFGQNLAGPQADLGVMFGNAGTTSVVGKGAEARRVGAIEQTIGGPAGTPAAGQAAGEADGLTPKRVIPETEISRFGQIRRGKETISPETGALAGTIEDRLLREYKKRDLTAEEEKALGIGAPGGPAGLAGEPRTASFRHPGWMARNYTPDLAAGVMRYEVPDKEAMAVEHPTWTPHTRTGKKGEYQYTEIKPKKGASALDALEGGDEGTSPVVAGGPKGTKVLLDKATREEINITRHPDMPWKVEEMPITNTTGMTRDGVMEDVASTPLSYHRAGLLRGLGLRNFYPDYGRYFAEDLARHSKPLFKELNAIFGAVASQASPETNLQRALAVMTAGRDFYLRNGRPPDFNELTVLTSTVFDGDRMAYTPLVTKDDLGRFPAGGITGADVKKVIEIWDKGAADIGAGWKTPVFGQNLESGALNRADPFSVPDTHMFRGRGHTQTGGGPTASVNSDLRALGITNATVVRLADEFGLTPFQVQSALWFVYKNELAPFNATDKAQIRNKMATNGTDWATEAARHDPWPKATEDGPDGEPRVMTVPGPDGTPMEVRQGTLPAVLRHVANVAGRVPPKAGRGQPKAERPRMDLMQAFRDLDAEFSQKVGRDSLTDVAADARLTFNGRLVTNPSQGGTVDLDVPGEGTRRVRSMEITPENIERAAFKLAQEAPVAIVPVDGVDGNGLARLGYDSQTGQIETLRHASVPHEVIMTDRPFTAGEPGKAETKSTARILFPGASLDTARYAATLIGERVGADEVALSWPTDAGRGRPVVSVEHPEGLEWTAEEIAKYPWAADLVGRANVSPDGRTLFFADLKPEEAKTVPWEERVGAVLEDAGVPPELVRRSADFGIERVGADRYGEVLSRAPLQAAGEVGQRAQAQFEAGEAVPGSGPTAPNLREYAGPERFRPEGAPVGSLGVRDGQPLRDTLDERLQMGQMVAGGLAGGAKGAQLNEEQDEQNPLKAGARVLGGGLLGATVGANVANPRRLFRAFQDARSATPAGGALSRVAEAGRSLAGDEAGRLGAVAKGEPTGAVPERGKQGPDVGLGDLDDPDNLAHHVLNPPEGGWQGAQQQELIRAMARRVKNPAVSAEGAKGEQVEAERGRRLERRREAQAKLDTAEGHTQTVDAVADAEDAARAGEITTTDADAIRGQAAKKLQTAKGEDGPPAPGEIDAQTAASRARRGKPAPPKAEEKKPNEFARARSGVTTLPAGVRAVTDKTPIKFPEREVTTRPGVAGEPARAAERVVQPGEGEAARNPLPGFEDVVPQIEEIARVADPEPIAKDVGVAGTAAEQRVLRRDEGAQDGTAAQAQAPLAPGVRRQLLPGVEAAAPRASTTEGPYVPDASGSRGEPVAASPEGAVSGETDLPPGVRGTADAMPVLDPRRSQIGPLEPGQIRAELGKGPLRGAEGTLENPQEVGLRRQELPGAGPREAPLGEPRYAPGTPWDDAAAGGEGPVREAARADEAEANFRQYQGERDAAAPFRAKDVASNLSLTDLMGRSANRLVDENGDLLSKEQVVGSVLGDLTQKGGTRALLNELDTWSDGLKAVVAGAQGVRLSPTQVESALSKMGQGVRARGGRGTKPSWEALSKKAQEGYADWRAGHILDAMGTYMRLNLVTNPESFARNVFSTTVGVPFRLFETATGPMFERAWGQLPRLQDKSEQASHAREVIAMGEGLWRSMAAGLANGMAVLRRGDPEANRAQLDMASTAKTPKEPEPLKPGEEPKPRPFHETRLAERMGTLFRPLTAGDAMLKTMNEGMEAYRLSYRQAKHEFDAGRLGEDSAAVRTRMLEIMNAPTPKMLNQIQQAGEYNTFNQKAGYLANRMEALKNWDGGGHEGLGATWRLAMNFLVPFVRITSNVMKYGFERTLPGGAISLAEGVLTKKSPREMGQRSARMLEGALMMGALYGLDQNGVIDINGPLPEDQTERDEWQMQGRTPYSVGAAGRYFGVGNIPGLAENVAMVGLLKSAQRKGEMDTAYGRESDWKRYGLDAVAQYAGQQAVRPMLGSVANAIGWATAPSDGQRKFYEDRLLRSAAGQLAPGSGTMRAIGNITDPTQRAPEGFAENVAAVYPFFRENLPARLDARGREMESEGNREWWSGVTSSTEARPDEGMPRRYLGSKSAAQDVEIGRAVDAVNAWKKDPRGNPPPTGAQRALAARYGGRENPQRKLLDQRVKQASDRLAEARRRAREDDTLPSPFAFQIPGIGA